ncbi:DUF3617 domain-containing protein [Sphingomonas sabuli]|uniref:DUF3617 domain-containing protein n=1 Tax=Sphingomonas sabuli TaxID=2764186 RepID=A0A7G9L5I8_9SPHN|nr:DUF3617 domain-containing protein [Sphingomonas sabuli]QNM83887.1 DUF3617 domain-containing protein [Sphingomonas sabuli]
MMMRRCAAAAALCLSLAACGSKPTVDETNASVEDVSQAVREASGEEGLLRPGKWQSSVTIEKMSVPGMPPEAAERMQSAMQQPRTAEACLTEEQAKEPGANFFAGNDNCRYDHFRMKGGKIDAQMRCASGAATQVMKMAGTYSSTSYDMRMESDTTGGEAGQAMTMTMRVESRRTGDCDEKAS